MERAASGEELIDLESLREAAECLRTLAHPHRLRIVELLQLGRYTVGELANRCEIPSNVASEHLRLMKRCGFLTSEREGRRTYYRIADSHLANILECVRERFGGSDRRG